MERTGAGGSVAADHHRYVLQQPVLVVHQPVLCTAFPRSKEPEGRSEGRYLLRLPQVPRPSVPRNPGRYRILPAVHSGQAGCCRFLRYRLRLPGSDR